MKKNMKNFKIKNNKFLAIALSISIIASCFSGVGISYAKSEATKIVKAIQNNDNVEGSMEVAPTPVITELEPETSNNDADISKNTVGISNGKKTDKNALSNSNAISDSALVSGEESITNSDSVSDSETAINIEGLGELYKLDDEQNKILTEKGYSEEDIKEAYKIGNEIAVDPKILLERKDSSKKSLNEVKEDVLNEMKASYLEKLKDKYKDEYEKLDKDGFTQNDIIGLLSYIDHNKLKLTDELIAEYKKDGESMFIKNSTNKVTEDTSDKNDLSDSETKDLDNTETKDLNNADQQEKEGE